jgi:hypothetical protein
MIAMAKGERPLEVSTLGCYPTRELLLSPWGIMAWVQPLEAPSFSCGEMSRRTPDVVT